MMAYFMIAVVMLLMIFIDVDEWVGHRWGVIINLSFIMCLLALVYEVVDYRYSNWFEIFGAFFIVLHIVILNIDPEECNNA